MKILVKHCSNHGLHLFLFSEVSVTFQAGGSKFQYTAVASMRRTEALASVKFYQILSIFIFFIRLIILEDFIRLISYNGPCVRLGCSFFLATALQ